MAYLVLARKYRPLDFDSVVHQDHVTTTLKNAINLGRVAHAHIFTGPRGTGKTTIARILAKCMNCEDGPLTSPCGKCISCIEISKGRTSDIIEIDGASNNSVEQIREIRDNLQYKPSHSKYKIYIIDEVHMLSTAAFNALLKSLEEPPSHIMFLFATTEPHKVPVTIMSRCQRHDLKRVPLNSLIIHLSKICELENISASEEILTEIASAGEGSVRDSMSLLDQMISSSEDNKITSEQIKMILGTTSFSIIKSALHSIFERNREKLISIVNDLYFSGNDLKIFYIKLTEYLRHIILLNISSKTAQLSDLPQNQKDELSATSTGFEIPYFTRLLDLLLKEEQRIRQTENIRILLEIIFLKLCEIPSTKNIETIISDLEKIRKDGFPDKIGYLEKKTVNKPQPAEDTPLLLKTEAENREVSQKPANDSDISFEDGFSDKEKWLHCIQRLKKENPSCGTLFEKNTDFISLKNNVLEIKAKGTNYHIGRIKKEKAVAEKISSQIFGKNIDLKITEDYLENEQANKETLENEKILTFAKTDILVKAIQDKLNGKIIGEKISDKPKNISMEDSL
ncbi:MAG: DNA polymerase III subunit gamma/tau [Desulfobacteraceae bacterium]|nr:DNA polymerase III subunit gamma/tau [Desulfobacteraceae bacterium]MCB9494615.1 DNA polymerase III subunit gamma/tau [Desulfobacteraceae bacterium]